MKVEKLFEEVEGEQPCWDTCGVDDGLDGNRIQIQFLGLISKYLIHPTCQGST